ncbi:MAG: tyrosine-type recombinase/integrase [Terriglobia bacterium]|nr:tyrosine-type recombinase/integrase [Terriglobia bacterium]
MAKSKRDHLFKRNGVYGFRYQDREGRWREKSTGKSDREDAKTEKENFEADLKKNRIPTDLAKRTVAQAVQGWLASVDVSRNTLRSYRTCLNSIVRFMGEKKLKHVKVQDIRAFRRSRKAEGCANRTINHEVLCLSYIMKEANLWHRIGEYEPLSEGGSKHSSRKPLTTEELNTLVQTAIGNKRWLVCFNVMLVAANTTCRPCEISGLQLGRIHLEGNYPHITISRATTKTDSGERDIPLNRIAQLGIRRLLDLAYKHGAEKPEHYLLPADLSKHTREYICPKTCACEGKGCERGVKDPLYARRLEGFDPSLPQRGWDTAWCKLRKAAGLPNALFYQLRHTSITAGAEENVPLAVMKSLAGHWDESMTEYYTSVRENPKAKAVDAIERANPALLAMLGLDAKTASKQ